MLGPPARLPPRCPRSRRTGPGTPRSPRLPAATPAQQHGSRRSRRLHRRRQGSGTAPCPGPARPARPRRRAPAGRLTRRRPRAPRRATRQHRLPRRPRRALRARRGRAHPRARAALNVSHGRPQPGSPHGRLSAPPTGQRGLPRRRPRRGEGQPQRRRTRCPRARRRCGPRRRLGRGRSRPPRHRRPGPAGSWERRRRPLPSRRHTPTTRRTRLRGRMAGVFDRAARACAWAGPGAAPSCLAAQSCTTAAPRDRTAPAGSGTRGASCGPAA